MQNLNSFVGALPLHDNSTFFRVWAPKQKSVEVCVYTPNGQVIKELSREAAGYFSGTVAGVGHFMQYCYKLKNEGHHLKRPDPRSAFQPEGVHGNSAIIDHSKFAWGDSNWEGLPKKKLAIYELHVGTFSPEGTFDGVIKKIDYLLQLGITAVEIMPIAQTPGKRNWGYDGVNLFATNANYGEPDDLKRLINELHLQGIAVILDVVYNHLGPEGNYLADFAPYFSKKHHTPWGPALNFENKKYGKQVRQFVTQNALYWLEDYHFDGLRIDAIHCMYDGSDYPIWEELADEIRKFKAKKKRHIHLIAEANIYDPDFLPRPHKAEGPRQERGIGQTQGYDAAWCDDIMHALYATVAGDQHLTPRTYHGSKDLAEALKYGYLYVGAEETRATSKLREKITPSAESEKEYISSLIVGLQTHDCVGNHPEGKRLHQIADSQIQRAAAALVLLYPAIPIMFQGEEMGTKSQFPFFCNFGDAHLQKAVNKGRQREYPKHIWNNELLPSLPATYEIARLEKMEGDNKTFGRYQQLLKIRQQGIEAGWLAAKNLFVSADLEKAIYSLKYIQDEKGVVVDVIVRLCPPDVESPPVILETKGELLYSSECLASQEAKIGACNQSIKLLGSGSCVAISRIGVSRET